MSTFDENRLKADLQAALQGDETAYVRFLNALLPLVRTVVYTKASGLAPADREDIAQEALMAIHSKKHTWRQDQPLTPWLRAITNYKVINYFRRQKPAHVQIEDHEDEVAFEDDNVERRYDMEAVVNQLKDKEQKVVRALSMHGKSIDETADLLNMSANNVRVTFHRALKDISKISKKMV